MAQFFPSQKGIFATFIVPILYTCGHSMVKENRPLRLKKGELLSCDMPADSPNSLYKRRKYATGIYTEIKYARNKSYRLRA